MDIDWDEDLDLGPASRYPDHLESPVFHWSDDEEDTQRRALGWLLVWRTRNPFSLKTNEFTKPVNHVALYEFLKARIADWAWLEKGGLDLEATHNQMIQRGEIRRATTPTTKGSPHVCKPSKNHADRSGRERTRAEDDPIRYGHSQLFLGNGQDEEG